MKRVLSRYEAKTTERRYSKLRIIFVRHGMSDYSNDCLTPEGQKQAAAIAERLSGEGIRKIYVGPSTRAQQTAAYTAQRLGLEVMTLSFMGEISWGGPGIPADGRPWELGYRMLEEGFDFNTADWKLHPYFYENTVSQCYSKVTSEFDQFLNELGYRHEGRRFLCLGGRDETLALFSHGGSAGIVMAHLLALPYPYVASVMPTDCASITTISFPVAEGKWVFPKMELFNDCGHIHDKNGKE